MVVLRHAYGHTRPERVVCLFVFVVGLRHANGHTRPERAVEHKRTHASCVLSDNAKGHLRLEQVHLRKDTCVLSKWMDAKGHLRLEHVSSNGARSEFLAARLKGR